MSACVCVGTDMYVAYAPFKWKAVSAPQALDVHILFQMHQKTPAAAVKYEQINLWITPS